MTQANLKQTLSDFVQLCIQAYDTSKIAAKNQKSLSGDNFYGRKFHEIMLNIAKAEKDVLAIFSLMPDSDGDKAKFRGWLEAVKSTSSTPSQKNDAIKQIQLVCQTKLESALDGMVANPIPLTEQVLPLAVVRGTRGYLEKITLQINGCYEHQWYDACSVMMRKIVEILIIATYEKLNRQAEIQGSDGNYLMLNELVSRITNATPSIPLGRETKQALPQIKSLGDRSAHTRHYLSTKQDIDQVKSGFRVAMDELLHLSGFK